MNVECIKYLELSKEYFSAYQYIASESTNPVNKFHAKYFLICRSIEYLLKSWLLFDGITLDELKGRSYRHNLQKLLGAVLSAGIEKKLSMLVDKEVQDIILRLNVFYDSKGFEYPEVGYKELPLYTQLDEPIMLLHKSMGDYYREEYQAMKRKADQRDADK